MKKVLFLLLLLPFFSIGQKNLTLLSNYTFSPGITCAGVWHYDDGAGKEYALVGTSLGLTIVDITNPALPQHVFDVPDTGSLWREVKVWDHYAYVSNEGGHNGGGGITIVDMSNLPGTPVYKKYTGDGIIGGLLSRSHSLEVDNGYLYLNGSRLIDGHALLKSGTIICTLADPWNPAYVGADTLNYAHDCFVRGDTLITSEIFANPSGFSVFNISDRSKPVLLASAQTPSNFNHNAWMSDDSHYLYTTDEKSNAPLASFDISDIHNISEPLDLYIPTKNPVGEVHNVRVLNDFLVNACYGDSAHTGSQVTIVDAARPDNLIEVGDYQLCPPGTGLMISWDADPYLPSGNLIATEGHHGLFVFAPTYRRACYLEGIVTDSLTGSPLNNVRVEILSTIVKDSTKFTGEYKTGLADSGTYVVQFSLAGYNTKTINGVVLKNGVLTTLNTKLWNGVTALNEKPFTADVIHVYPNPAHEEATIHIHPSLFANHSLRLLLTDALGRTVQELSGISQTVIPLSRNGIDSGTYTLQLLDGTEKIGEAHVIFQ